MSAGRRLIFAGIAVALAAAVLSYSGLPGELMDEQRVRALIGGAGPWGPVAIVGLMTLAVVFSPLPSAPVALAAGAIYGHVAGTVYVLIGAEAGALIAFGLARALGREALNRRFGEKLSRFRLIGSQWLLMWLVFVSRLMPFVSFDLISYAAGLSPLAFWRFALATLAGILPASFVLAHLGGELARGRAGAALWLALGLGLATGLPLIWGALRGRGVAAKGREGAGK